MQRNIIELVTNWKGTPQEAEREVVAAISSAEGGANLLPSSGRAVGIGLPLLSLAAGAMVGYGAARWLLPWLWSQPAIAPRPIVGIRAGSIFGIRR
jgi:hypothetical protein